MAQQWILYGTLGCHLCDQAQEIVCNLQQTFSIVVQLVDVSDDPSLVDLYGDKIPVLKNSVLAETLYWPFDVEALTRWLEPPTVTCQFSREG